MYVTFINTQGDNVINAKLQSPIEGYTQVGVAELFYNPNDVISSILNEDECKVYMEYDLKTDKETILYKDVNDSDREITPYTFFNNDGDNELVYS